MKETQYKIWIYSSQNRKSKWLLKKEDMIISLKARENKLRPLRPKSDRKPLQTYSVQFSSVSQSCPTLYDPMNCSTQGLPVHHQLQEFTQTRPSSQWCHPAISSSVVPSSFCPQSLPATESFPMSQLFSWGGQSTGVSALASFLPKNSQGWSPSEWTGWVSLQSKGLSRVFSNTTVQKHPFFGAQLSSQSNSHIHTWPLEKPWLDRTLLAK